MDLDGRLLEAVRAPVATIDDVLAVMAAIQGATATEDGIRWFNGLYYPVTKNIHAAVERGEFLDPTWATELDVVFARLYFGAVRTFLEDSDDTPEAWLPLFERRAARDVYPLQFALAGMNAHIDRDLSFALVELSRESGRFPDDGSVHHRDYLRVNDILAQTERETKAQFEGEFLRKAEFALGRVEDVVALFGVETARDAAWTRGRMQWDVRDIATVDAALARTIDRAAAIASRALLLPTRIT